MSIRTCFFVGDRTVRRQLLDYEYQMSCDNFETAGIMEVDLFTLLKIARPWIPNVPVNFLNRLQKLAKIAAKSGQAMYMHYV